MSMPTSLKTRWNAHLHDYFADWAVPDSLVYLIEEAGTEPVAAMESPDWLAYAHWLEVREYVTTAERHWLQSFFSRADSEAPDVGDVDV